MIYAKHNPGHQGARGGRDIHTMMMMRVGPGSQGKLACCGLLVCSHGRHAQDLFGARATMRLRSGIGNMPQKVTEHKWFRCKAHQGYHAGPGRLHGARLGRAHKQQA